MKLLTPVLLVLAMLFLAGTASAAYPGSNGRIAFYRADGYIYSVKTDGSGLVKLGLGQLPAYSPDGNRIAFSLNGDIWTMNANGTNRQRVTSSTSYDTSPTWSPDGTKLAFASDRNGGGIYVLRSAPPYGSVVTAEITPTGDTFSSVDYGPAWATNGLIYFTRDTDDSGTLCDDGWETMSVNPSTHVVAHRMFAAADADPAPRAKAIVFTDTENGDRCTNEVRIGIANIDGSNVRGVTPLRSNDTAPLDSQPVFSPDATKVAFQRGRYIYTVNAAGSGLHRLVLGSAPTWQPR